MPRKRQLIHTRRILTNSEGLSKVRARTNEVSRVEQKIFKQIKRYIKMVKERELTISEKDIAESLSIDLKDVKKTLMIMHLNGFVGYDQDSKSFK